MPASAAFRRFATGTIVFTLAVILWGAFVRATGSGAGCGSHWPTCNGEIVPRAPSTETLIEYTHRTTSGVAFLLVLAQLGWALRAFPRGHGVRRAAGVAMLLMVTEALVGAGLVIFEKVAGDESTARAYWTMVHLGNTFALVAALVLVRWCAGTPRVQAAPRSPRLLPLLYAGLAGLLAVGGTGAIAALGDTLFPATSLAEGVRQDFLASAHLFVRIRALHPLLAVIVGGGLLGLLGRVALRDPSRDARALATTGAALVLAQLGVGLVNLALLAPVAMQLVHLLLADLVWIALVVLTAEVRRAGRAAERALPVAA